MNKISRMLLAWLSLLFFLFFRRALNERQRAIMEEFAQEEVTNGDYMDGEVNL